MKKKKTSKLFNSLLHKYQETLENKMEGSSFVFDYVNYLDINFQTIDLIRGSSYVKSPLWISKKKQLLILKTMQKMMLIAFNMQ